MEHRSGNTFIRTKRIEYVSCHYSTKSNRKLRKGRNKTDPDVVSSGLDLSTEEKWLLIRKIMMNLTLKEGMTKKSKFKCYS